MQGQERVDREPKPVQAPVPGGHTVDDFTVDDQRGRSCRWCTGSGAGSPGTAQGAQAPVHPAHPLNGEGACHLDTRVCRERANDVGIPLSGPGGSDRPRRAPSPRSQRVSGPHHRRRPSRPTVLTRATVATLVTGSVLAGVFRVGPPPTARGPGGSRLVTVTVSTSKGVTSELMPGVTYTQNSLLDGGNQAAMEGLLRADRRPENIMIMGWGTDNPEPSPGTYDWATLDARIQMVRDTNGIPVITLCCAPDWMKGGQPGSTDWSRLDVAPLPSHYEDFAQLAKQIALRYPDVRYFDVWNEFKGFWIGNRFDYVHYTQLYNDVYDAIKSVRPDAQIGGPYPTMNALDDNTKAAVEYWLAHKHGAQFLSLDATMVGAGIQGVNRDSPAQRFRDAAMFTQANEWVQSRTNLPIWWAEYYLGGDSNLQRLAALDATVLVGQALHNGAGVLLWEPKADGGACLLTNCLFTDGGQPLPGYFETQQFLRDFPVGTTVYPVTSSSSTMIGLASQQRILLVNQSPIRVGVLVAGRRVSLPAYGVVTAAR